MGLDDDRPGASVGGAGGDTVVAVGGGIELCYDAFGDEAHPAVVLIAGLGQQKHSWHDEFAASLADRGHRVIRFDNRDVGRSTHADFRPPKPLSMLRGGNDARQYDLGDMARDTVGLLDVLGYRDVHLVGVSMGGMIAQTVAARHPGRVRTLTSIMSTTGAPRIGRPAPSTWVRLATARPPRNRADAVTGALKTFRHIGSHGFPFDEELVRDRAALGWDRDPTSAGAIRQLAGIFAAGDRTAELRRIQIPTLVLHGDRDRMVHPSGGAATAAAIPGARLETIAGMGHDLPRGAWDRILDLITAHVGRPTVPADETH